jgi:serine/threonine-protein kinase TTK/MPS1
MELGEGDLGKVLSAKLEHLSPDPSTPTSEDDPSSRLDFTFIRYWWKEMLLCVQAVHEKDIVHSDLKPANFLVVKSALKLIDFGIAGAIDVENTVNMHRDSHVGTPNYMSPESLQDSSMTANPHLSSHQIGIGKQMKLGKPSDVWSLGCILYQMVYGSTPFGHISAPMSKVLAIINHSVSIAFPPTGLGGTRIPPELLKTMRACLDRDPSERPTLEKLLADNDPWLHPEAATNLRIPQALLNQIVWRVAQRYRDKSKPPPTEEEINQYAPTFYAKIQQWADEGLM